MSTQVILSLCLGYILLCISEGIDPMNVALGKTAYQSSTLYGRSADRAVDGGLSQMFSQQSCTETKLQENAFWEVDLGQAYSIYHVTIYNRKDCCGNRLRDVQLLIRKKNGNYTLNGYHEGIVDSTYTFQLKYVVVGDRVRITRNSSVYDYMNLCEVQVFGKPYEKYFRINREHKGTGEIIRTLKTRTLEQCGNMCLGSNECEAANFLGEECELLSSDKTEPTAMEGSDLMNVALGKKAYQSSTYSGCKAGRAVDGGMSQAVLEGSCTETESDTNAFWEVDLGQAYSIYHITIYNRNDCCGWRLRDMQLLIGSKDANYMLKGHHNGTVPSTYTFQLDHVVVGNWVRITRNSSTAERLTLCEVHVFGKPYERDFRNNPGQKGTGEIIRTWKTRTLEQCGYMCLKTNECEAANFLGEECELLSTNTTETTATGTKVLTVLKDI